MGFYRWQANDLLLHVHIQPKASHNEIVGAHGEALKVRIKAPPIEGRANEELIAFLAAQFGVAKSSIELLSGHNGRQKRLRIASPQYLPAGIAPPV